MKNCPYCREDIQEDAMKCKHCGEWLIKVKRCASCNALVPQSTEICPACGIIQSIAPKKNQAVKKPPVIVQTVSQRKMGWLHVIFIFIIVLIIQGFILTYIAKKPTSTSQKTDIVDSSTNTTAKDDLEKLGANWIEYYSKDGAVFYYDKDSVEKSFGTVKVWFTMKYGDNSKIRESFIALQKAMKFPENLESLSHTKLLTEIDCGGKRQCRTIRFTHYDKYGKNLYTSQGQGTWGSIPPDSATGRLSKIVCK